MSVALTPKERKKLQKEIDELMKERGFALRAMYKQKRPEWRPEPLESGASLKNGKLATQDEVFEGILKKPTRKRGDSQR